MELKENMYKNLEYMSLCVIRKNIQKTVLVKKNRRNKSTLVKYNGNVEAFVMNQTLLGKQKKKINYLWEIKITKKIQTLKK